MEGARALGAGTRILVADESRHSRGLLAFLLRANGYEVTEATHGREALDTILIRRPHLVILEAFLPGKSGFEISAFLKGNPVTRRTPIILMSSIVDTVGRDAESMRRRCSADDFLTKPFTLRELLDRIERLTGARASEPA